MTNTDLKGFFVNDMSLQELNNNELLEIHGGLPSGLSSFFYDVAWIAGAIIRSGYEMGKAAKGNPHI